MAAHAIRTGLLSQAVIDDWLTQVRAASAAGGFLGMVTMTAASGRRPPNQ